MASDLVLVLIRANLWAIAASGVVWLLRAPVRRAAGPEQAFRLWAIVPLAMLGALLPPIFTGGPVSRFEAGVDAAGAWLNTHDLGRSLLSVWALGALVCLARVAGDFADYRRQVKAGRAGPAILGVVAPRLILPSDFAERFTAEEADLIRAHERAHIDRGDARIGVFALALQILSWFNPVLHLAARAMRFDQELACDAAVLARRPQSRKAYAAALIAAQAPTATSPFGCGWRTECARLLSARLKLVMDRGPRHDRPGVALVAIAGMCASLFAAAWLIQPPSRPQTLILLDITAQR